MIEQGKLSEWIEKFNSRELYGADLIRFLELLKENPDLRREVILDKDLEHFLADEDLLELRKRMHAAQRKAEEPQRESGRKYLLLAASVLLVLGMGLIYGLFRENRLRPDRSFFSVNSPASLEGTDSCRHGNPRKMCQDGTGKERDSTLLKTGKTLYASNFRPYKPMEGLVGAVTRSEGFFLLSPVSSKYKPQDSIVIEWKSPLNGDYSIRLVNNRGNTVQLIHSGNGRRVVIPGGTLSPGLFYFCVLCDGKSESFGKFLLGGKCDGR
jgi:hypothetical protein